MFCHSRPRYSGVVDALGTGVDAKLERADVVYRVRSKHKSANGDLSLFIAPEERRRVLSSRRESFT